MATDLTTIFGSEITVYSTHRQADRQYSSFAGAHGLLSMLMGSSGAQLIVRGTVRGSGADYAAARADAADALAAIENYLWTAPDSYSFGDETYENIVWEKLEKLPDAKGVVYHWTSTGDVIVNFIASGRSLT